MAEFPASDIPAPDADASAATPAPRRRRSGVRLAGGLLGAFVVAAGIGVPWMLSSPGTIAGFIQSSLKGAETDVSVERVQIGWLGPIVVEGIRFQPRDGSPQPVSIKRVEGDRGLLGMLLSFGDLGRFRVSGLEVDVVFDKDRQANLKALLAKKDSASGGDPTRRQRRLPVATEIDIEQAVVRIAGPWTDEPWVSEPIDVAMVLEPEPGQDRSHWRIGQVQLLNEAVLDPTVSQGVLAYIAPILADATIVGGRFSLSLESASLPVGDPGSGTLDGHLVMHAVDIGPGELVKNVLAVVPLEKPQVTTLRISESSDIHFGLADRRVRHEGLKFGVPLPKTGERLDVESAGSVGLDDRSLQLRLSLPLPTQMPEDRPLLKALAGKNLGLSIGGTLEKPEVDMDGTLRSTVEGLVGRAIRPPAAAGGNAAGDESTPAKAAEAADAGRENRPASTKLGAVGTAVAEQVRGQLPPNAVDAETADAVVDLVGGLLDEVGRRRAARKAAEEAAARDGGDAPAKEKEGAAPEPEKPARSRGGLLKRILERVDEAAAPQPEGGTALPKAAGSESNGK
jgi:hypothetical protein